MDWVQCRCLNGTDPQSHALLPDTGTTRPKSDLDAE